MHRKIMYKVYIIVISVIVLLIVLSVVGLRSLESFYRKMTLATMPLQFLMAGIHAAIFVFMYLVFLRGGFAKLDKAPIKGRDIDVKWKDVIGMEAAKMEAWEVVQLIRDRARLACIPSETKNIVAKKSLKPVILLDASWL